MRVRTHRLTILAESCITLDGKTVAYTIKRSARIRCVRIELRAISGVAVVIPRTYDVSLIPDLLRDKQRWILNRLEKYAQSHAPLPPLKDGDTVPYLGRDLTLMILKNQGVDCVNLNGDRLIVGFSSSTDGNVASVLKQWYRLQGEKIISQIADKIGNQLGLSYNRLTIRGQKTRWASCSRKGNLSFNWKLVMIPEKVIEYVVIHELLHLKEMNHSKRFWNIVAEHCPDWRMHRKCLKDNEMQLNALWQAD